MQNNQYVVVLDPGHGGRDRFNVGMIKGYVEADGTLIIATAAYKKLKRNNIIVIMTRGIDKDLALPPTGHWCKALEASDLTNRAEVANRNNADYFVSVHTDANTDITIHGTTGYCYHFGGRGERIAYNIVKEVTTQMGTYDRGVKEGNLAVLRETKCPAALIEVAFHTNANDCSKLANNLFLIQAGEAIADGIMKYLNITSQDEVVPDINLVPVELPNGQVVKGKLIENQVWAPVRPVGEGCGRKVTWIDGKVIIS